MTKNSDNRAGAPSLIERNLQWLKEIEDGIATVRMIADREFLSPGAVRMALKEAKCARGVRLP
jgi:hypothetical protein